MQRLSLAYLTVQGCPPLEHVRIAARNGYDAVGLRLIAPLGLQLAHPIVGDAVLIRVIKTAAEDLGITFLDGEVFTLREDTDVESWFPVIDTAAEFGMPLMQITCEDRELARAADNLGRIADRAAEHGIAMAIEFMRWRAVATIDDAERLAEASERENVGILLDCLHLSRSGGSPAGVRSLKRAQVLYVQLCDAPQSQPGNDAACIAEARGERLQPGEGDLPLDELLDILPGDIAISVETPHRGDDALSFDRRAGLGMAATKAFLARRRARTAS